MSERFVKRKHTNQTNPEFFELYYHPYRKNKNFQVVYGEDWNKKFQLVPGSKKKIREKGWLNESTPIHKQHPIMWADFYSGHPQAHACAAFCTRPKSFSKEDCVIVSIDGVGENESIVIFNSDLEIKKSYFVPKSIGFLYAAFTQGCGLGLRATSDEYVVMGLSSYGEPKHWEFVYDVFHSMPEMKINGLHNVFGWRNSNLYKRQLDRLLDMSDSVEDAAASLQYATEILIQEVMQEARNYGSKLCYSGGVAQNIVANSKIKSLFDDVWIDVNPGDGGQALGAAAWKYWKDTGNDRIEWNHPFLGHEIEGTVDPEEVVEYLLKNKVCGLANGKAEYSYRAYGNRSLIADVRYDVKDTVNTIKRRQKYRPFAPAILEEHANDYFEGPMNRWMQYAAKAKHDYSSVTHVDGTARVQLVPKDHPSIFRKVIECYYEKTGVPMLLNTSLNIRGMPMVNDYKDAKTFEEKYEVKVFTGAP
jgi:carbamoyltransferase